MTIPNKTPKTVEPNINDISRISQGAVIRGDLTASTDIRVDGQVDGTLFSEGKVVVGEVAKLSGKLFCANVDYWGKMTGDLFVKDTLTLKNTSTINGNIHTRKIQVEMGAQINGSIKMISEQEYDQLVATMVRKGPAAPAQKPAPVQPAAPAPKPVAGAPVNPPQAS